MPQISDKNLIEIAHPRPSAMLLLTFGGRMQRTGLENELGRSINSKTTLKYYPQGSDRPDASLDPKGKWQLHTEGFP